MCFFSRELDGCLGKPDLCDIILTRERGSDSELNYATLASKNCKNVPGHWWLHCVVTVRTNQNSTHWEAGSPKCDAWEAPCSPGVRPSRALWPFVTTSGLWWCQASLNKLAWARGYLNRRLSRNCLEKDDFVEGRLFLTHAAVYWGR